MERQNKIKEFITAFIAKEGFPIWHKARIQTHKRKNKNNTAGLDGGGDEDTTVYIPLVVNAQQYVHGFLKATITDMVDIEIFRQNDYNNFPFQTPVSSGSVTTAENFAMRMMMMDNDVFGSKEFKVADKRLFHNSSNYNDTAGIQVFVKIDSSNGEGNFANGSTVSNTIPPLYFEVLVYTPCAAAFSGTVNNTVSPPCWNVSTTIYWAPWGQETENASWPVYPPGGGGNGGGSNSPGGGGGSPCGSLGASMVNGFVPIECEPGPGGNPWPPVPAVVLTLQTLLTLDPVQIDWLSHHLTAANEIKNYLQIHNGSIQLSKDHLDRLISDNAYFIFNNEHYDTGDPSKMWWQDEPYLKLIKYQMSEWAFNFYMKNTRPANLKPEEFADKCEGLKQMAERTRNDNNNRERLGFLTLDGKIIITFVGEENEIMMNLIIRNGTPYYHYPAALGLPTLDYYQSFVDPITNEVMIPIRADIHTHGISSMPLDWYNSKSSGDLGSAQQMSNCTIFVQNYVISVDQNNKYSIGTFDDHIQNTRHNNVFTGLALNDICQHVP